MKILQIMGGVMFLVGLIGLVVAVFRTIHVGQSPSLYETFSILFQLIPGSMLIMLQPDDKNTPDESPEG